jgi:hypothetical protein
MKILLEPGDYRFVTTVCPPLWNVRWMAVTVGGKLFHVRREYDRLRYYGDEDNLNRVIDQLLIEEMEYMLTKHLSLAAALIPDGPLEIKP